MDNDECLFSPSRGLAKLSLARRERLLSLNPSLKDKQAHKYTLPDWVRLQTPIRNQTPSPFLTLTTGTFINL
ncbi:unnamed protein product [Arctogadus glacialis]